MTLQDKIAATADKCKTVAECALKDFSDNFTLAALSQDEGWISLGGFVDPSPAPRGFITEVKTDGMLGYVTHYRYVEESQMIESITHSLDDGCLAALPVEMDDKSWKAAILKDGVERFGPTPSDLVPVAEAAWGETGIPPEIEPLAAAIGKAPANDNAVVPESFFDRAMKAPCGAERPVRRDVKMHIVNEAARVVTGARQKDYGKPEDNFERIAKFWQAYFENTGRGAVAITAQDVSPMMRLMKEARLCESPSHLDSFVDLVGYTMTGAEVNGVEVSG